MMDKFIGEKRGLCKSQSFPPKESNNCINLRGKPYMVFVFFLRARKQGRLAQQKAENCSFVQKRRNFVTRVLVVYVVTGHYKVTFSYENKTKTWALRHGRVVRNKFFRLIKIYYLKVLASMESVLYPCLVLTSFLTREAHAEHKLS